ncbi:hypothetical protein T492DRAFT_225308 [Pavlovales sp. CCMP2436]|nr:hypothetical protein T492DRAFT_225308 [Pavlovales sp. CCMP2436]
MHDHIHNCQILHYTRTSPDGHESPWFTHMRSVCPWDSSRSRNTWEEIQRPKYDSTQLMHQVCKVHRIIDDDAAADRLSEAVSAARQVIANAALASSAGPAADPSSSSSSSSGGDSSGQKSYRMNASWQSGTDQASMFTGAESAHPDAWSPTSRSSPGIAAMSARAKPQAAAAPAVGARADAWLLGAEAGRVRAMKGGAVDAPAADASAVSGGGGSSGGGKAAVSGRTREVVSGRARVRPMHLKRVALVGKSTRLDRVGSQALNVGDALAARLRDAHTRHSSAIDELASALQAEGMLVTMVGVQNAR